MFNFRSRKTGISKWKPKGAAGSRVVLKPIHPKGQSTHPHSREQKGEDQGERKEPPTPPHSVLVVENLSHFCFTSEERKKERPIQKDFNFKYNMTIYACKLGETLSVSKLKQCFKNCNLLFVEFLNSSVYYKIYAV